MKKLITSGQRIVEQDGGGEVILHGLNLICKDPERGCLPSCTEEDFCWMAEQGFNVLRLGVIWSESEPESGCYNASYLRVLRELTERAGRHGIYVFLDMHQDLYSILFSDGAPAWATLTDDLPHLTGEIWSDAYLESPAVIRALDHFWQNTVLSDGMGLQDHYAKNWRKVAEAFANCENLIGFDLMNEPFPGSRAQEILTRMLSSYVESELKKKSVQPEEMINIQALIGERDNLLKALSDFSLYQKITGSAKDSCGNFEREILLPFYQKVVREIGDAAGEQIIFLESSYFSNMAVESGLQKIDTPYQIYAPHGYDLVVDTDCYEHYSLERTRFIFETHRSVQQRLNLPVLVGEWGAFYRTPETAVLARQIGRIFAEYGWSDTYWSWESDMRFSPCIEGLCRGYPQRIGGRLIAYRYEEKYFWMKYHSDGSPCRIYLPGYGITEIVCPAGIAEIEWRDGWIVKKSF